MSSFAVVVEDPEISRAYVAIWQAAGSKVHVTTDLVSAAAALARGDHGMVTLMSQDAATDAERLSAAVPEAQVCVLVASHATRLETESTVVAMAAHTSVTPLERRGTALLASRSGPAPTALIVDDDNGVRMLLAAHLSDDGWAVDTVGDGPSAVERTHSEPFDLVVLDLGLPGLHGLDVLHELRASPAERDMSVVVISGSDDLSDIARSRAAGADAYITKPFSLHRFDEELAGALAARRWPSLEAAG